MALYKILLVHIFVPAQETRQLPIEEVNSMKSIFDINNLKHFLVAELFACALVFGCFGVDYSAFACM